ncbi:MAG: hypothetical protein Q7S43_04700 [bacterium]|nr:hypothetical protein [bacterium]
MSKFFEKFKYFGSSENTPATSQPENLDTEPPQKSNKLERLPVALDKLREQAERFKEIKLRPRVGIITDKDKIENQQVDVIDSEDIGVYQVTFKLTESWYKKIIEKVEKMSLDQGQIGYINNGVRRNMEGTFNLAQAFVIKYGEIIVRLSRGTLRGDTVWSSLGLVQVEIPKDKIKDSKDVEAEITQILQDFFEISDGFEPPGPEDETRYKLARYTWHHKLDTLSNTESKKVEKKLQRKEVFPGYFTFVEEDKHKEYKSLSPFVIYHSINNYRMLGQIIKSGGLMATHERYRRGLLYEGMSSSADLIKGGGDSVFTRTLTKVGLETRRRDYGSHQFSTLGSDIFIIFEPRLFDRTDWYAYGEDMYGQVSPEYFSERESPAQLFENQKNKFANGNEQMFRLGIAVGDFKAIMTKDITDAIEVSKTLKKEGILEINGMPVDRFIFVNNSSEHALEISMGTKTEAQTLEQFKAKYPEKIDKALFRTIFSYLGDLDRVSEILDEFRNLSQWQKSDLVDQVDSVISKVSRTSFYNWSGILGEFEVAPVKYRDEAINKLEKLNILLPNFYKNIVELVMKERIIPLEALPPIRKSYSQARRDIESDIKQLKGIDKNIKSVE